MNANIPNSVRAHIVGYDIPTKCNPGDVRGLLRRIGVRLQKSVWIVPDANIPRIPVDKWEAAGMKIDMVRFDERDGETILKLARRALALEADAVREVLEQNTKRLRSLVALSATGDPKSVKQARSIAGSASRHAKRLLESAKEAALAFDLLGDVEELFKGVRETIRATDTLYYGWVKEIEFGKQAEGVVIPEQPSEVQDDSGLLEQEANDETKRLDDEIANLEGGSE